MLKLIKISLLFVIVSSCTQETPTKLQSIEQCLNIETEYCALGITKAYGIKIDWKAISVKSASANFDLFEEIKVPIWESDLKSEDKVLVFNHIYDCMKSSDICRNFIKEDTIRNASAPCNVGYYENKSTESLNRGIYDIISRLKSDEIILEVLKSHHSCVVEMTNISLIGSGFTQNMLKNVTVADVKKSVKAQLLLSKKQRVSLIEYFPKANHIEPTINKENLYSLLNNKGFTNIKTQTPEVKGVPTNSIWFSKGTPIEEVKDVAYALIAAGAPISRIRPFSDTSKNSTRENLIQIGASIDGKNRNPYTLEEIKTKNRFTRQN